MDEGKKDPLCQDEDLLARCLSAYEGEGPEALEAILSQHPDRAAELRGHIGDLFRMGLLSTATGQVKESDDGFPSRLGDFVRGRRLGGGGMGVVFEARQESLGRDVALKMIRPDRLHLESARRRFQTEVETIAQLKHQGIVPVYSVGEEGGIPFFAMELVDGCTLEEAIRHLSGQRVWKLRGRDLHRAILEITGKSDVEAVEATELPELFQGRWETTCLRIIRQVALALGHAHAQGVLHRDLKPSNILITAEGRVLLFDFGLTITSESARLTQEGSLIGSPAYMAPEQVREEEISAAADIYGLGVTFYELLCLELPFLAHSMVEIQQKICLGEVIPPRHRNRALSWDVETICLVAMDRERTRRFRTAAEFTADLQRVLKHEPIHARRPGPVLRARRWSQRHPAVTVALVLGTLLFAGGPTALWLQQRSANEVIAAQKDRAENNLATAMHAVDYFVSQLSSRDLQYLPYLEELSQSLLENAVGFYEGLLAVEQQDPNLRQSLAGAQRNLSWLYMKFGKLDRAMDAAGLAARTVDQLLEENPGDAALLELKSLCQQNLGVLYRRVQRVKEAEQALKLAMSCCEQILDVPDRQRMALVGLGVANRELGSLYGRQARFEEANVCFGKAVSHSKELLALYPRDVVNRSPLAYVHDSWAVFLNKQGREDEALQNLHAARKLYEELLAARPDYPIYRSGLASCLENISSCPSVLERGDALPASQRSVEILTALVREFPSAHTYKKALAYGLKNQGTLQAGVDKKKEAKQSFLRATNLYEEMIERGGEEDVTAIFDYLSATQLLAIQRLSEGTKEGQTAAESLFRKAIARGRELAEEHVLDANQNYRLGKIYSGLGTLLIKAGRLPEARKVFAEVLPLQERMVKEAPSQRFFRLALARTLNNLGNLHHFVEDAQAAMEVFNRAAEHKRYLLERSPDDLALHHSLAGTLYNIAAGQLENGSSVAWTTFEEARKHSLLAVEGNQKNGIYSKRLLDILEELAMFEKRAGNLPQVRKIAESMVEANPQRRSCRLRAALLLAQVLPGLKAGSTTSKEFADQAIDWIGAVVKSGYKNPKLLVTWPGLRNLEGHPGFGELMQACGVRR